MFKCNVCQLRKVSVAKLCITVICSGAHLQTDATSWRIQFFTALVWSIRTNVYGVRGERTRRVSLCVGVCAAEWQSPNHFLPSLLRSSDYRDLLSDSLPPLFLGAQRWPSPPSPPPTTTTLALFCPA